MVIGSDIAPIAEIINPGVTGHLVKAGHTGALGGALVKYADRDSSRQKREMGKAARRFAKKELDNRKYVSALVELYHEALKMK